MNEYQKLQEIIKLHRPELINAYFDLVKEVLEKYSFTSDDSRIGLTVRTDNKLPLNIGNRWVISAVPDGTTVLLLGPDKEATAYDCTYMSNAENTKNEIEGIWVTYSFSQSLSLPPALKAAWLDAVDEEVRRGYRSPYKKFHSTLFYDAVMDANTRKKIMSGSVAQNKY